MAALTSHMIEDQSIDTEIEEPESAVHSNNLQTEANNMAASSSVDPPTATTPQACEIVKDELDQEEKEENHSSSNNHTLASTTQQSTPECPIIQLEIPDEESDEESNVDGFRKTCRFVARIGWYACYYGATPSRVEVFLQNLMQAFGYTGSIFRVTNSELFCAFSRQEYDDEQVIRLLELKEGLHLHRLSLLSEVCKQVRRNEISQLQAWEASDEIAQSPDPWGFVAVSTAFVLTGALAPAVFQGTWWDLLGGALSSIPVYLLTVGLPGPYQKALPLLSAFASTMVAITVQRLWVHDLHVELVVLASVIIQVPGYGASLAVSEIITNHITAGVGRLVNAMVTLGLLVGGYWLANNLLEEWKTNEVDVVPALDDSSTLTDDPVPVLCQILLCAPGLMICLCILFQISPVDTFWSFGNLMLAYGTSYGVSVVSPAHKNVGVLMAAAVVTIYAQAWARWKDRPRSIVITPALVLLVSGSIGFRGLVRLTVEEDGTAGLQEFAQMFVVALLIMAGVLIGNLLLRAPTTL